MNIQPDNSSKLSDDAVNAIVRGALQPDVIECEAVDADVPLVQASAGRSSSMRLAGGTVAAGCAVVLGIAIWMTPSPRGFGTHEQLGLPPCGFLYVSGMPCPTCGMTSAFAWMMHGHPIRAMMCQPMGALLCLGAMAGVVIGIWMAFTGRWLIVDWVRFSAASLVFGIAALFFVSWGVAILFGYLRGDLPFRG